MLPRYFLLILCAAAFFNCGEKKTEVRHAPPQYTAVWDFFESALTSAAKGGNNGLWIADRADFERVMKDSFMPTLDPQASAEQKRKINELMQDSALFFKIAGNTGHLLFLVPGAVMKGGKLKYVSLHKTRNTEMLKIVYLSPSGEKENGDKIEILNQGQSRYLSKQGPIRIKRETRSLNELMKVYAEPFTKQTSLPEY